MLENHVYPQLEEFQARGAPQHWSLFMKVTECNLPRALDWSRRTSWGGLKGLQILRPATFLSVECKRSSL